MKCLLITKSPPYPSNIGGSQRTNLMFRALSLFAETDLLLVLDESDLPVSHLAEIRRSFRLIACIPSQSRKESWPLTRIWPAKHRWLDRLADYVAPRRYDYLRDPILAEKVSSLVEREGYDVVVCKGLSLAMKTGLSPDFPMILDVDDVEIEWYTSQVSSSKSGRIRRLVAACRLAELESLIPPYYKRFKYMWVVKENDRQYGGLEDARVVGVPYYTPDGRPPDPVPPSDGRSVVLMVGSFYHRPNVEGLTWFAERVWPGVKQAVPDAVFRVVGPGLSDGTKARLDQPGIDWIGPVPHVASEYQRACFTIAPIWSGAGINVKVFESLAYGRPSVVTPFAFKGYEHCLKHGLSIHVAGEKEDFASGCIRLLKDPPYVRGLAEAGRPAILDRFSFERFAGIIERTVMDAVQLKTRSAE